MVWRWTPMLNGWRSATTTATLSRSTATMSFLRLATRLRHNCVASATPMGCVSWRAGAFCWWRMLAPPCGRVSPRSFRVVQPGRAECRVPRAG